ncbi:MAG: shikimate kinase [Coriobacteriaceae bacterium]|nr:shikimate kinase [Coriobacteriaceae bacterium]
MSSVFIVGFMGAGKSTVGRLVAGSLGLPYLDLDAEIESRLGATVGEIFDLRGEAVFREAEREALARAAEGPEAVVSCGGGVVLDDRNRSVLLASGPVVHLRVTPEEALARVGGASDRPLLRDQAPDAAAALLRAREALYEAVADVTVETVGRTPEAVAADVMRALEALADEGGSA